jgi:superfamily II DNA or RNA helicase
MSALHSKASYWLRKGIFDDLRSFDAFEDRVNKIFEEKDRGDIFEIFVEGYLATQTITQRIDHWVVGNIPLSLRERYKLPNDGTGIDGIYETHDGSQVAYQVKYRQKEQLNFAEVAPFLGITEQFSDRVIFTNAATLSDKAVIRTRWVNGEVFRALSPDALSTIEAWLKQKPLPIVRAKPDPNYQVPVLEDIKATLATHDRATVVMACGTGKTLVSLWAAEQEAPRSVLVLVPSLTLLKQTLLEWSEQTSWGNQFSYLCVCSDPTVDLKDDALNTDTSEVGFRVDTDPAIVRQFLERETTDIKVVFSTYQSAHVVGEGANGLPPFDLAIFDEAHKTIRGASSYAISNENIRIRKRLFLTATPHHIDIHRRDKEGEFRFYSMDDEAIYGPRAHTLSFGAAANKGIICRYKVIVALIDKAVVNDFTRREGITLVDQDEVGARWMANLIAVQKAIEEVDANKIISFHSRVRLAQEFASKEPRGVAYHLPDYDVRHVNGEQSSGDRAQIIEGFKNAPKAILTNARCLTEGINIPAVDMVAFIDPRQSRIDIAQAVGRAMRKPRGPTAKTVGYVVVPVFAGMSDEDSIEDAIKSEKFESVIDVLNSLQEHDEELVDIIREIRERKGEGEPFNPRSLNDKLEVIGPRVDLDRLMTSIGVEIADRIGNNWDEMYGRLIAYKREFKHVNVPAKFESDKQLGVWVAKQREPRRKRQLTPDRIKELNDLGFDWDPIASDWERNFERLATFKRENGHAEILRSDEDKQLAGWVTHQRQLKRSGRLDQDRANRLDKLGLAWDPKISNWERNFQKLVAYRAAHGDVNVSSTYSDKVLKNWVVVQRQFFKNGELTEERTKMLNSIKFSWSPFDERWEQNIVRLEAFKNDNGHANVPANCTDKRLATFIGELRVNRKADKLSADRIKVLDTMGFDWDPLATIWETRYQRLVEFKNEHGHINVSEAQDRELASWVYRQRSNKKLSMDRVRRLKNLTTFGE